jgi:hypothetical protein
MARPSRSERIQPQDPFKKNEMNHKLLTFYQQRKLKWNAFMNKKRSEARMTNMLNEISGSPEDIVIGFGDWEQRKHMKFKQPTKGKGSRLPGLFGGRAVAASVCEKFRECKNPQTWASQVSDHGTGM